MTIHKFMSWKLYLIRVHKVDVKMHANQLGAGEKST